MVHSHIGRTRWLIVTRRIKWFSPKPQRLRVIRWSRSGDPSQVPPDPHKRWNDLGNCLLAQQDKTPIVHNMNFRAKFKKLPIKTQKTLVFIPFAPFHSKTYQTLPMWPWTSMTQFDLWLISKHCHDSLPKDPCAIKLSIDFPANLCFFNDCCIFQVISRRPELG